MSDDHEARREAIARELGEPITCDRLTKDFVMYQRRRGHRHSTDDLLTAWYAATHLTDARPLRLLDLGSGIGSIGLAVLWVGRQRDRHGDRASRLTAVEAQEVSFRFLRENVEANGVADLVRTIHGDLRDRSLLEADARFDVITGSPPYFDVKAGIVSVDSQRAHARFELRGDVRDYARAAARHLSPRGRFVLCFPTVQRRRAEEACEAAGFGLVAARDVVPKQGTPALFSLLMYARAEEGPVGREEAPFVVRDAEGVHTDDLRAAQDVFGLRG